MIYQILSDSWKWQELGLEISYKEQPSPDGLAQAFIIGEDFIGNDDVCLVLEIIFLMVMVFQNYWHNL